MKLWMNPETELTVSRKRLRIRDNSRLDGKTQMRVLIVESDQNLGWIWQGHMQRAGAQVSMATTGDEAIARLDAGKFDALILDLVLTDGSAFAVADYARFRHPEAKVVFVTDTSFFSDGSIFALMPNVCAFMPSQADPADIAAIVEHHCVA